VLLIYGILYLQQWSLAPVCLIFKRNLAKLLLKDKSYEYALITLCPRKNVHLFIFWITLSKSTHFNNFWYFKFWENLTWTTYRFVHLTCHFNLGNPKKSHFSTLLFIYFRLFTLTQKKTNNNCCTATLAVYVLLFDVFDYLHSPSSGSGARYRRSACIDMDMLRLVAAACCDMDWISAQRGVLYDWSVSKKTGSMY